MAQIFQKNDSWWIDYSVNGRRKRKKIGPSKQLAETVLRKTLVEIAENRYLDVKPSQQMGFKEFADIYIDRHLKINLPNTWWKSEKHNVSHLKEFFGTKRLHEITEQDIQNFIGERLKFVGKTSVNKNLACLKSMFNKAIDWEISQIKNPAKNIKPMRMDNKRTRYLEKEEIVRLLECCDGHLKNIVEFAVHTGMRKGEIFNLKWQDVNLRNGIMTLLKTKNGEIRHVPINKTVEDILFRVRKDPQSPYVFASRNGKPFNDIKHSFYTALNKAEIKDFRFHDLRHTFASQLMINGANLFTVKELLGHKELKMTMRYAHLSCDHKKGTVKLLDNLNSVTKLTPAISEDVVSDYVPSDFELRPSGS